MNAINPIVLAPVKTKWVCQGSSLDLKAELAPTAGIVTWFLNDSPLSSDPRADICGEGDFTILTVKDVKSSDAGILRLQTKSGSAETRVNVIEPPSGLRLRKEKEGALEARWTDLPPNKSLGFYEVQIGSVSGSNGIKLWLNR